MNEHEERTEEREEVPLPDDRVEDLAPDADGAAEVKGGVYQWWKKVETDAGGS